MRIETGINLNLQRSSVTFPPLGAPSPAVSQKSLGDVTPVAVSMGQIPALAALFSQSGKVGRLARRLNYLKNKKCRVVPAKGTIACIDDEDVVYVGIDFLREHLEDDEVLAGVLAHEWGHACARKPRQSDLNKMPWDEIFKLRKAHEVLADYTAGRLLALLGLTPRGIVDFLKREQKGPESAKYYDADTRGKIILSGFKREKELGSFSQTLFPRQVYANHHHGRLIDIV